MLYTEKHWYEGLSLVSYSLFFSINGLVLEKKKWLMLGIIL